MLAIPPIKKQAQVVKKWELETLCECASCSCPLLSQPVLGHGNPLARLVIVGEAPGETEVKRGKPFEGVSGELIWRVLKRLKVDREDTYATNALLCVPEEGKGPNVASLNACAERLATELDRLTEKRVILCLGRSAATSVRGESAPLGKLSGLVERNETWDCWVVTAYHPAFILRSPHYYKEFVWAVKRAVAATNDDYVPPRVDVPHLVVSSPEVALELIQLATEADKIVCDVETDGLDPREDALLEIGLKFEGNSPTVFTRDCWTHTYVWQAFQELFAKPGIKWIGHNFKFDCEFLRINFGVSPEIGADTMLLSHAYDERSGGEGGGFHDLKTLARKWCDAGAWEAEIDAVQKARGRDFKMSDVPDPIRWKYHAVDLEYTWRLYPKLREALLREPLSRAGYQRPVEMHNRLLVPAANALVDIELRGILVDVERLDELDVTYAGLIADAKEQVRTFAGAGEDFNPNSWMQVQPYIYAGDRYPDLKSTGKDTLHELQRMDAAKGLDPNPLLSALLDYRSLIHTRSLYLDGIRSRLGSDNRIRTNLLLHGTTSGRLASRSPNLQNLPADSVIRELFIASPGRVIANVDYKQLEVRVLAWYSEDSALCEALKGDLHWSVSRAAFPRLVADMEQGRAERDLTRLESIARSSDLFVEIARRQERAGERTDDPEVLFTWLKTRLRVQSKKVTFGVMYGEGAESLSLHGRGMGVAVSTAAEFIERWSASYPDAIRFLRTQARYAATEGWVESASGRRRRFVNKEGLQTSPNEAMNHPIQSFASDICLTAMTRLNKLLPERGLGDVLLSVHDSILFELVEEQLDTAVGTVREVMTGVVRSDVVVFDVDVGIGPNWGKAK